MNALESHILELDGHSFVMDLQPDGATVQASRFGVVRKLGRQFAVDLEEKVIAARYDVDLIPLVFPDIRRC